MVTILDVGLMEHFSTIFSFLLVFVIVFALMEWRKMLGDNSGLHALISFLIAMLFLAIPGAIQVVSNMAPWFIVFFIFLFFVFFVFMMFGTEEATFFNVLRSHDSLIWTVIVVSMLILIWSISQVYGPALAGEEEGITGGEALVANETATTGFEQTVKDILFHPKVLGLMLILLIAAFAVRLLSTKGK